MESIIQVVEGDNIDLKSKNCQCIFCNKDVTNIFGVTKGRKYNGIQFKFFGVCDNHLAKIDALLSGEYDIDLIWDTRIPKTRETINLRACPPIEIARTHNKKEWKQCKFIGCTNNFYGIANRDYCSDPRCIELRREYSKARGRRKVLDPDVKNIVLVKRISYKIKKGQVLKIRCRARNAESKRCNSTFLIRFDPKQSVYPAFCEEHRSAYRRIIFSKRRG